MSHFTRELSDGDWYRGLKIPEVVIRNIDEKTKKAVSESGGSWAPSSPIVLAGAGLELQGGLLLSGGAAADPAPGKNYFFGDDDYFQFSAAQTRKIDDSPLLLAPHTLHTGREARAVSSELLTTTPALQTRRAGAFVRMPIRVPDGSRILRVDVDFKVAQAHASLPDQLPRARVVRIAADGTVTPYPNGTTASADPYGWVSPAPANGTAYYALGALQTLVLTFDPDAQPAVDRAVYDYAIEWREESGTNAFTDSLGNLLVHFQITVSSTGLNPY